MEKLKKLQERKELLESQKLQHVSVSWRLLTDVQVVTGTRGRAMAAMLIQHTTPMHGFQHVLNNVYSVSYFSLPYKSTIYMYLSYYLHLYNTVGFSTKLVNDLFMLSH